MPKVNEETDTSPSTSRVAQDNTLDAAPVATQVAAVFPQLANIVDTVPTLEARLRVIELLRLRETVQTPCDHGVGESCPTCVQGAEV